MKYGCLHHITHNCFNQITITIFTQNLTVWDKNDHISKTRLIGNRFGLIFSWPGIDNMPSLFYPQLLVQISVNTHAGSFPLLKNCIFKSP